MRRLYHALANPHRFRMLTVEITLFLLTTNRWAYLLRMVRKSASSIAFAIAAILVVLGAPSEGRAGSYGQIDAFVVRQKIKRDLPKINRCYESALRYEPELAGKVSVRFAVVRNGDVKGVHVVENTTGNDNVERCVARVVSTIRFPRRRTGKSLRFTFPFVFCDHA